MWSIPNSCRGTLYPLYLCNDVVREGFDVPEPPPTLPELLHKHLLHLASPGREGFVQLKHLKLLMEDSIHLSFSGMLGFEKVEGGLICLNHPELLHKHPVHL